MRIANRIDRLLTKDRLLVYPGAILILFILLLALRVVVGGTILPDYLARWTAGRLVVQGDYGDLYDMQAQHAVQEGLAEGAFSWFVSPPPVALVAAPLGALPYALSAAIWSLLSMAALYFALVVAGDVHPSVRRVTANRRGFLIAAASLPALELLGGGQDSAFFLLALALAARFLARDQDVLAGLTLSVFVGKPQLAVLIPVVLVLFRRWRVIAVTAIGAVVWTATSIAVLGGQRWVEWTEIVLSGTYRELVSQAQATKMVTIRGLVDQLLPPGASDSWATGAWALLAAVVLVLFGHTLWGASREALSVVLIFFVPLTTLLVTAHAPVYELVAGIPAACYAIQVISSPVVRSAVAIGFVLAHLNPTLTLLADPRGWPLSIVAAGWVVLPMVVLWSELRKWLASEWYEPQFEGRARTG